MSEEEEEEEKEGYILVVPLGPRLLRRTSWRPRAATMFICRAAPRRATSALGFRDWRALEVDISCSLGGLLEKKEKRRRKKEIEVKEEKKILISQSFLESASRRMSFNSWEIWLRRAF